MQTEYDRILTEIEEEERMLAHSTNRAKALKRRGAIRSDLGRRILGRYEAERRAAIDRIALLKQSAMDFNEEEFK